MSEQCLACSSPSSFVNSLKAPSQSAPLHTPAHPHLLSLSNALPRQHLPYLAPASLPWHAANPLLTPLAWHCFCIIEASRWLRLPEVSAGTPISSEEPPQVGVCRPGQRRLEEQHHRPARLHVYPRETCTTSVKRVHGQTTCLT